MCPREIRYGLVFQTPEDHQWRSVAILDSEGSRLGVHHKFGNLRDNEKKRFLNSFDAWCANISRPKRYHGWDKSEQNGRYADCFVFKGKENASSLRLYGFLCHPKSTDPRFLMCALAHYAYKNEKETDFAELDRVLRIMQTEGIMQSIKAYFKGASK
jgi:hypothetical protein